MNAPLIDVTASPSTHTHIVPLVWISCVMAAASGLLFGMDVGIISGAIEFIRQEFVLSTLMEGWIVGSLLAGAAFGALGASAISNMLGRKRALLLSGVLFFIGALLAFMAWSPGSLVMARVLLGLAIGVESFVVPMYLSEIAPRRIRGTVISCYQLMITVGILVAYLSNLGFSYAGSWRWMFGILMLPAVLMTLGVLILPESPRWLAIKGRLSEARMVLKRLRATQDEVTQEIDDIQHALESESRQATNGWTLIRSNSNFRRSVMLGIGIQAAQQFTGINVMIYFAPRIFEMANFQGTAAQLWSTVAVGVVNVLATFIAVAFVDKWGRKPILYTGFMIMAVSMAVLGGVLGHGVTNAALQALAMGSLLIFIVGFAMSAGPLAWTLCAEIQPMQGRDFGIGCSTIANWVSNMLVGTFFLTVLGVLGGPMTFALLAVANLVFVFFTFSLIPETSGVKLEQIEHNLMSGKPLRKLGR